VYRKITRKGPTLYDKERCQVISIPYGDRLTKLGLLTLQKGQLRGDLIDIFEIINRFDSSLSCDFSTPCLLYVAFFAYHMSVVEFVAD